ncbi:MAG: chemotaxis protein CheA [Planctomycetota bacterium]
MSGPFSAIEALALKLVLLGRLDRAVLSPLLAELAEPCATMGAAAEWDDLNRLLADPDPEPAGYNRFSNRLEDLRRKLQSTERRTAASSAAEPGRGFAAVTPPPRAESAPTAGGHEVLRYDTSTSVEIMNHFFLESGAHLDAVEAAVLHLENQPQDFAALTSAFGAFHSLKGVTGFLDLNAARDLVHDSEGLIDRARRRETGIRREECDLILRVVDAARGMLDLLRAHVAAPEQPLPLLPASYRALRQELQAGENCGSDADSRSQAPQPEGARPAHGGAPAATAAPTPSEPTGRAAVPAPDSAARATPSTLSTANASPAAPDGPPAPATAEPRQEPAAPDASGVKTGEPAAVPAAEGTAARATLFRDRRESDHASAALVRVHVEKLDRLVNAIGELAITQLQIFQDPRLAVLQDEVLQRRISLATKTTRELQTLAMTLRMVPLKETFARMTRIARDLAHRQAKEVQVLVEGADTELDKSLIELMVDPLTHLIRNAVDHAVDEPAVRERQGKPARATLRLAAHSQGGYVVVEVGDDGRGLDLEKIRDKARAKGWLAAGQSADAARLQQFIFEPGFSTAQKVTDVSGRGIGLDVVRSQAAHAGGRVHVASTPGRGTTFTITLPLTLAIIDGLLVRVGRQEFILPMALVIESLRPTPAQLGTVHERGRTLELRGRSHPLVQMGEAVGDASAERNPCHAIAIIVEDRGERFALQVDEILGVQQVVIKGLGDRLQGVKGISGGAILGDGRVRLILDAAGIVAAWRAAPARAG